MFSVCSKRYQGKWSETDIVRKNNEEGTDTSDHVLNRKVNLLILPPNWHAREYRFIFLKQEGSEKIIINPRA